jgi:hypothetical protein
MFKISRAHHLVVALLGVAVLLAGTNALVSAGGSAPAAPTNLDAIVVGDALKITLLWDDNSDNEEQFILERSSASAEGPWGVAALLPADSTSHHDGGLGNNVTYWYRVAATNAAGTSDYSNVASGTASELPAPPPGDADCSGNVTSVDAALVLQFDAGVIDILTFTCLLVADVNEDSVVNSVDATLILQFVAGLIPAFVGTTVNDSGIQGMVTIGPICPVVQPGVPCPDLPFSAKIIIEDETGVQVASVVSKDDGTFQIDLDAGNYILVPESPNPGVPPTASEQAVEVVTDTYTAVVIQYDSGIR